MNKSLCLLTSVVLLLSLMTATAHAEVTVSVTLTGSVDEMLPILQHLRDMGVGIGPSSADSDSIKLQVHSMTTEQEVESAPDAVPPPQPVLALTEAAITPAQAKPGEMAVVSVKVCDPDHVVDTLEASVGELGIDLADNGSNGDAVAGDGVWSAAVEVPAGAPDGPCSVKITAYDAHGYPVSTPGAASEGNAPAAPLSTEAAVTIAR